MSAPEDDTASTETRPLIRIEWRADEHDCDDCGPSYAEGAVIHIEGREPIEMLPSAHCFDGTSYGSAEVYTRILEELGYRVANEDRRDEVDHDYLESSSIFDDEDKDD
jgi:hypothetical protein